MFLWIKNFVERKIGLFIFIKSLVGRLLLTPTQNLIYNVFSRELAVCFFPYFHITVWILKDDKKLLFMALGTYSYCAWECAQDKLKIEIYFVHVAFTRMHLVLSTSAVICLDTTYRCCSTIESWIQLNYIVRFFSVQVAINNSRKLSVTCNSYHYY